MRARAAEPSWGGSAVQGTPGLPRPGRDRRGGAATYPLLRVSGGSRSPPKVFASLKSFFGTVGSQTHPHPTPHILLLRREVLIENFLFHTRSVLTRLHLTRDRLVLQVWPQTPTPHFIFYILWEEPLGNNFPGLFVLEDPSSLPNKLAKDVYLCGLSKVREREKKCFRPNHEQGNSFKWMSC